MQLKGLSLGSSLNELSTQLIPRDRKKISQFDVLVDRSYVYRESRKPCAVKRTGVVDLAL